MLNAKIPNAKNAQNKQIQKLAVWKNNFSVGFFYQNFVFGFGSFVLWLQNVPLATRMSGSVRGLYNDRILNFFRLYIRIRSATQHLNDVSGYDRPVPKGTWRRTPQPCQAQNRAAAFEPPRKALGSCMETHLRALWTCPPRSLRLHL